MASLASGEEVVILGLTSWKPSIVSKETLAIAALSDCSLIERSIKEVALNVL